MVFGKSIVGVACFYCMLLAVLFSKLVVGQLLVVQVPSFWLRDSVGGVSHCCLAIAGAQIISIGTGTMSLDMGVLLHCC